MPSLYRYTSPISKKEASGTVARVYAHIGNEFILTDGPLMSLSPVPDLLAATWALLREAQLAGGAPRINREVIAVAVSAANHCHFCVDAHTAMIHAAGEHQLAETIWRGETPRDPELAALVAWSKETARPGKPLPWPPGAEEFRAAYVGTALVTHFINRVVERLVNTSVLTGRLREPAFVRRVVGRVFGRTMRLRLQPGESLPLLEDSSASPPDWAVASPVGIAYAALRRAASAGGSLLSLPASELVHAIAAGGDGSVPAGGLGDLLVTLPEADRPGAKIALLAALAPHGVADADVVAWRVTHPADDDLIRLIAFGAFCAVEHVEASLAPPILSMSETKANDRHSSAA